MNQSVEKGSIRLIPTKGSYSPVTCAALRHRPIACLATSALFLSIIPAVALFHTSLNV